jgi:hypothetical protein
VVFVPCEDEDAESPVKERALLLRVMGDHHQDILYEICDELADMKLQVMSAGLK